MYPTLSMCLTLSRCHTNIPVTPRSCFVDCLNLWKEKGLVTDLPPLLPPPPPPCQDSMGRTGPEQRLILKISVQSLLHPRGLPRLFFLLPALGRTGMISPWPLNLCTPKQYHSVLSFATSGTLLAFYRHWHPPWQWVSGSTKATGHFLFGLPTLHGAFLPPKG